MDKAKSINWKYFQRIGVIVAIIASIGTLIGVYYQLQTKKSKVELQLLSIDYLTSNNNIDNLSSNYKYKGEPVKNLWLAKYKIVNIGDLTIIGEGTNKNIIGNKIKIKYNSEIQILDNIKVIQKDFPIEIVKEDSIYYSIYFDQWRINESAIFSLYLKSENKINDFLPFVVNRPIIDGDILINDYTINSKTEKKPIIDYWEEPFPLIIRIVSIIVIATILILLTFLFSRSLIEWIRLVSWKSRYYDKFKTFINSELLGKDIERFFKNEWERKRVLEDKDEIINEPWSYPMKDEYWEYFDGEKVPVKYPDIESWKGFFGYIFLLFLEILIFSLIILSIIKK